MDNINPPIKCPICQQDDLLRKLSELSENDELFLRLAPPDAPEAPAPLVGVNEGLGCLGALFFGSAFFLSVAFESMLATIIFGIFVLFFAAAFLLTIWRGIRSRRQMEGQVATWQGKMETWERLVYCAREPLVFDPQTGQHAPIQEMNKLLT